jgi:lysozyme
VTDLAQVLVENQEECRLESYLDTEGVPTNGWGHTGSDVYYPGQVITQDQADAWLAADMSAARNIATRFPFYYQLNDVRQAVLVSMAFQMGSKPLYWPRFMSALEVRDYADAQKEGLASEWAEQTPERAQLEMSMLASGEWELPA